jgi:hypothetical protein
MVGQLDAVVWTDKLIWVSKRRNSYRLLTKNP